MFFAAVLLIIYLPSILNTFTVVFMDGLAAITHSINSNLPPGYSRNGGIFALVRLAALILCIVCIFKMISPNNKE